MSNLDQVLLRDLRNDFNTIQTLIGNYDSSIIKLSNEVFKMKTTLKKDKTLLSQNRRNEISFYKSLAEYSKISESETFSSDDFFVKYKDKFSVFESDNIRRELYSYFNLFRVNYENYIAKRLGSKQERNEVKKLNAQVRVIRKQLDGRIQNQKDLEHDYFIHVSRLKQVMIDLISKKA